MVKNLFIKINRGQSLTEVSEVKFTNQGLLDNVLCLPLRHLLILPSCTLDAFNIKAGDLRENVVVDYDELHNLPSGTALKIGEAIIRLTFHCEPCNQVKKLVNLSKIQHKRGYLGQFQNTGKITVGDRIVNLGVLYEPVPYNIKERLHWFLTKTSEQLSATDLLKECGLSSSYARALPVIIKNFSSELKAKIVFAKHGVKKPLNFRKEKT